MEELTRELRTAWQNVVYKLVMTFKPRGPAKAEIACGCCYASKYCYANVPDHL